jgi:hypothetical protein
MIAGSACSFYLFWKIKYYDGEVACISIMFIWRFVETWPKMGDAHTDRQTDTHTQTSRHRADIKNLIFSLKKENKTCIRKNTSVLVYFCVSACLFFVDKKDYQVQNLFMASLWSFCYLVSFLFYGFNNRVICKLNTSKMSFKIWTWCNYWIFKTWLDEFHTSSRYFSM